MKKNICFSLAGLLVSLALHGAVAVAQDDAAAKEPAKTAPRFSDERSGGKKAAASSVARDSEWWISRRHTYDNLRQPYSIHPFRKPSIGYYRVGPFDRMPHFRGPGSM